ncbi:hypothetical protein ACA910_022333 [Epithemia clementina (nom. ined.)]
MTENQQQENEGSNRLGLLRPVKVYILAGQSNMLEMGTIQADSWRHTEFYQTPEPSSPLGVFVSVYDGAYDSTTDYDTAAALETHVVIYDGHCRNPFPKLPQAIKLGTWVARGYVQVKITGLYVLTPGYKESTFNITEVEGRVVHRREPLPPSTNNNNNAPSKTKKQPPTPQPEAVKVPIHLEGGKRYAFKTTFLTQTANNAFWMQRVDVPGTLDTLVKREGKFPWLLEPQPEKKSEEESKVSNVKDRTDDADDQSNKKTYRVIPNVWFQDVRLCGAWDWDKNNPEKMILDLDKLKQACRPLKPESGVWVGVPFGHVIGDYHHPHGKDQEPEQVLLIRSAMGNRALAWDFRPPSSGRTTDSKWEGLEYSLMVEGVQATLENIADIVPNYQPGQGYEIMGFVWFQGHKDTCNKDWTKEYETNLVHLVQDVRHSFQKPQLPFVIGTVGFQGHKMAGTKKQVWQAQMAVGSSGADADDDENGPLGPNVATVDTRDFWREANVSPTNQDYHYNRNAETYLLVGDALANRMIKVLERQQECSE